MARARRRPPGTRYALLALTLLLAGGLSPLEASNLTGFLPGEGHGTVAIGYTSESYDEFWRGSRKVPNPGFLGEISTRSNSLWLNWGVSDRLAVVIDTAYVDVDSDGTAGLADAGAQDLSALLEYRLWRRSGARATHALVGAVGGRTPLESYAADAPVARGDETTDALLRLVYLFHAGRFYLSQQVGYDLRGAEAPDGIPIYTELGWSARRVTWIGWYSRYLADSGSDIGEAGFSFPGNREELERIGGKAILEVANGWSAFLGAFATLDGRNTGVASGWSVGVIRRF